MQWSRATFLQPTPPLTHSPSHHRCIPSTLSGTFFNPSLFADGPLPSKMQKVTLPIINNTECEMMYEKAGFREHIPHIFICAGYREGGKDSCEVKMTFRIVRSTQHLFAFQTSTLNADLLRQLNPPLTKPSLLTIFLSTLPSIWTNCTAKIETSGGQTHLGKRGGLRFL